MNNDLNNNRPSNDPLLNETSEVVMNDPLQNEQSTNEYKETKRSGRNNCKKRKKTSRYQLH